MRSFLSSRSGGRCCPSHSTCLPGCTLPCCASTRCAPCPPPPCRTRLPCPDPCSPPRPCCPPPTRPVCRPPRRTFRSCRTRSSSRCSPCNPCRPRSNPRCSPCNPCRPRSSQRCVPCNSCDPCDPCEPCSPCLPRRPSCPPSGAYRRPLGTPSKLYSPFKTCLPKTFGPLNPCGTRSTRCDPCRPRISDLCCPSLPLFDTCPSPCTYKPKGCKKKSPCRRRIRRSSASPQCPPRRCSPGYTSSIYSSSCETSMEPYKPRITKRSTSLKRCPTCKVDPCCCQDFCNIGDSGKCSKKEDASRGPTKWFLNQSGKLKCKSPSDPHLCPWEADVTVTGTVRGHCTSTAVEVAKRLTGKFVSRGQRYTSKKGSRCKPQSSENERNQRMTLGYLDDGTKLDFSRNRCSDRECADYHGNTALHNGSTNNASIDAVEASTWSRGYPNTAGVTLKVRETKRSCGDDVGFTTAYLSRGMECDRGVCADNEVRNRRTGRVHEDQAHASYPWCSNYKPSFHGARPYLGCGRTRSAGAVVSDSDISSYQTASESPQHRAGLSCRSSRGQRQVGGGHTSSSHGAAHRSRRSWAGCSGNRHSRSRNDGGIDLTLGGEQSWPRHRSQSPSTDEEARYYMNDENDVIDFDPKSEDDCECDREIDFIDNDDIDEANQYYHNHPHHTYYGRSMAERCARAVERRHYWARCYKRQESSDSKRHKESCSAIPFRAHNKRFTASHTKPTHYRPNTPQSSEEDLIEGTSSLPVDSKSLSRSQLDFKRAPTSKYLRRKKRVTYGDGL